MRQHPAERIERPPVTVRRWRPDDAPVLQEAVLASLDHLRPWMAWAAHEPLTLEDRRLLLERGRDRWDAGEEYSYGIFADDVVVGGCGLHRRIDADGLEIGYWVRAGRTGHGIAGAAVSAMVEAAFDVDGITHVEIHTDRNNLASGRVAERAGFEKVREHPHEIEAPAEEGVEVIWRLDRSAAQ